MQYTRRQVIILPQGEKCRACCVPSGAAETLLHEEKSCKYGIKLRKMARPQRRNRAGAFAQRYSRARLERAPLRILLTKKPFGMPNAKE
jgi:hypothetical protein